MFGMHNFEEFISPNNPTPFPHQDIFYDNLGVQWIKFLFQWQQLSWDLRSMQ